MKLTLNGLNTPRKVEHRSPVTLSTAEFDKATLNYKCPNCGNSHLNYEFKADKNGFTYSVQFKCEHCGTVSEEFVIPAEYRRPMGESNEVCKNCTEECNAMFPGQCSAYKRKAAKVPAPRQVRERAQGTQCRCKHQRAQYQYKESLIMFGFITDDEEEEPRHHGKKVLFALGAAALILYRIHKKNKR